MPSETKVANVKSRRSTTGDGSKSSGQVQSLIRGLTILERLAEVRDGDTLTDLAQRVGLAPSTTHRLLKSLEQMHFVSQDAQRGRWFIGVQAFTVGKALLAALPDDEVSNILHRRGLTRVTPNTIDTPTGLREALVGIRRCGYALDDEEHAVGLRCVAATLYDEHAEPLAAISLSGSRARP